MGLDQGIRGTASSVTLILQDENDYEIRQHNEHSRDESIFEWKPGNCICRSLQQRDERYQFVERVLRRFSYTGLRREEKGIVIQFIMKVSKHSRQQRKTIKMCSKKCCQSLFASYILIAETSIT